MLNVRITQARRMLLWLMLVSLTALLVYFALRAYLSPELLFNFSNG